MTMTRCTKCGRSTEVQDETLCVCATCVLLSTLAQITNQETIKETYENYRNE
jgi:hypothetical protein